MSNKWVRYWIVDVASGLFDMTVHYLLRLFPIDFVSWIGSWLPYTAVHLTKPGWIERAAKNYQRFFPSFTTEQCQIKAEENWRTIGRTLTEFSVYHRFWEAGRITVEGQDVLDELKKSGRPVIGMALHLGNWELIPLVFTKNHFKTRAVYMQPKNRFQHMLVRMSRFRIFGRKNFDLIPSDSHTIRRLSDVLSVGGTGVIYVDEYVRGRVNTPTFGGDLTKRCNLNYALRLAARYDAIPVLLHCVRVNGARFKIVVERIDLPYPDATSKDEAHIGDNQKAVDAMIEERVRAHIDQWFNFHVWKP